MLDTTPNRPQIAPTGFRGSENGAVSVLLAICLVIVIGIGGLAVDYGMWIDRRNELQANVDKAALEGALELVSGTPESAEAKARLFIAEHGGNAAQADVSVNAHAGTVRVKLRDMGRRYLSVFHLDRDVEIPVTATAAAEPKKGKLCALALDETGNPGIHLNGEGVLTGPECIVWSNSHTGNAFKADRSVTALLKRSCAVGIASNSSRGIVSPPPQGNCRAQPDPMQGFRLTVPEGCDHRNFSSSQPVVHLRPGTYCGGMKITSDTIIAAPGIYHIKSGIIEISGTSRVSFDDATIYMSGDKVGIPIPIGPAGPAKSKPHQQVGEQRCDQPPSPSSP